ncbi:MAG: SBBP repeat-containing protein [Candidatus Bathyarchaeia archaeon]
MLLNLGRDGFALIILLTFLIAAVVGFFVQPFAKLSISLLNVMTAFLVLAIAIIIGGWIIMKHGLSKVKFTVSLPSFRKHRIRVLILACILIVTILGAFVWQAQEQKKAPSFLLVWGSKGSGPGQFNGPGWVAVDSSGNVYVTDWVNGRVQKFTSTGMYITQWGNDKPGSGPGQLNSPRGVAVDSSGNVYVADAVNSRVEKFTSDGRYLTHSGSYGSRSGAFGDLAGVAVDSSGNVYVADYRNSRIVKFGTVATISVEQVMLIIAIAVIVMGAYLTMRKHPKNLRRRIVPT